MQIFSGAAILDVDIHDVADIVIGEAFFPQFKDRISWRKAICVSANILKKDGLMIMEIDRCKTWRLKLMRIYPSQEYKKMTRDEALEHAEQCFGTCFETAANKITV